MLLGIHALAAFLKFELFRLILFFRCLHCYFNGIYELAKELISRRIKRQENTMNSKLTTLALALAALTVSSTVAAKTLVPEVYN